MRRSASSWGCPSGASAPPSGGALTGCGRQVPCGRTWPRRPPTEAKEVASVCSPEWTDDELLQELRSALQEEPVAESVIRAAQAAFTWRTVDAELELLSLEAGDELAAAALMRGGAGAQGSFAFHGERLIVEIEVDGAGIVGQLTPPQPGQVTLVSAEGPQATAQADEVGYFTFPPPAPGPLRLDCQLGGDHFVTEWVTVRPG